jgi:SAM-dependent methyltransferase
LNLSRRGAAVELMDGETVGVEDDNRCLRDLAAVNRITLTHRPTLRWLTLATSDLPRGACLSILDVACGDGYLLGTIHHWAERRGLRASLEGIDLNPRSAARCRATIWMRDVLPHPRMLPSHRVLPHPNVGDAEVPAEIHWHVPFRLCVGRLK